LCLYCAATLPIILAYRRGNEEDRKFWRRTLAQKDQRDGDLEKAVAMMNQHGTLVDTIARAQHYGAMAKDALGIFPKSELREALINIVDFCIERAY